MSSTISSIDLLLIAGQLERQHAPDRLADLVGDPTTARGLRSASALPLAQDQPELKEEELLEDQPPLRRRAERVQLRRRRRRPAGKCASCSALAAVDQLLPLAHCRAAADPAASSGSCGSAWCTSARCIFGVSVPVFS